MTTRRPLLPGARPGGPTSAELYEWLSWWLGQSSFRQLAAASGWDLPAGPPECVLAEVVERSTDWDFRAGAERHGLGSVPAKVGGRAIDDDFVIAAAAELGLVGGMPLLGRYRHVVILGGMVQACLNRCRHAAGLAVAGESSVTVLTAHRLLPAAERAAAESMGWGSLNFESEAAEQAVQAAFGLGRADETTGADPAALPDSEAPQDEQVRRRAWTCRRWGGPRPAKVCSAPSSDPDRRRADTADQLRFWADRTDLGSDDRILLVTTEHYVPYVQLRAATVVGLDRQCSITTTGPEWKPAQPFRGQGYLQELRSAALAAAQLLAALETRR